jgi:hypothetical protein
MGSTATVYAPPKVFKEHKNKYNVLKGPDKEV